MDAVTTQPQVPQASGGHHHHHHGGRHGQAVNDVLAQALGMSADDLKNARAQGQSLADIARSKGVSVDDLQKALSAGLQKSDPNISSSRADQIAAALISGPKQGQDSSGADAGANSDAGSGTQGNVDVRA